MKNYILSLSSLLFLIPVVIFYDKSNKYTYEYILSLCLILNTIISFIFWSTNKKKSLIHKIDILFAKITFVLLFTILIFIKEYKCNIGIYINLLVLLILYIYKKSSIYSKQNWGSFNHILYHFCFHILSSLICSITFTV